MAKKTTDNTEAPKAPKSAAEAQAMLQDFKKHVQRSNAAISCRYAAAANGSNA